MMGSFGQKAVQEALLDNQLIAEQIKERERAETEASRRAALGNYIFDRTVEEFPQFENAKVLKPYNSPRQYIGRRNFGKDYLINLGFGENFDKSKIALHASGDRISGWMRYGLTITKENSNIEDVCWFSASKHDYLDSCKDVEKSETHLWKYEDDQTKPIEYMSEDYEFVKNIAGLFLPSVIGDLGRIENVD